MARFKWHADYYDSVTQGRCVRRTIIEADNACQAEKDASAHMDGCRRVEVRRVATAAPIRVIHAQVEPRAGLPSPAELVALVAGRPLGAERVLTVADKGSAA
jgi:hypothetical protein